MVKFSEEQMQKLWLLDQCLTQKKMPINEDNKKRIVDFVRFCINNRKINQAAYHLISTKKDYPEAATNFILILTFRTRRLPEVSTLFENMDNVNIESFRHYAILRDISRVKVLLNELEDSMLDNNPKFNEFKTRVSKTHDKINEIENEIKKNLQHQGERSATNDKKINKLEKKFVDDLKKYFSQLVNRFKAKNFPHP